MRSAIVTIGVLALLAGCGGPSAGTGRPGSAQVSVGGATYDLGEVEITLELGAEGWFRIDGEPLPRSHEDCVPGLSAGLSLYGDLPASVEKPLDLIGKRLRVDFTGDGDEANFCFAGMGGLAGAEDAWVTFVSVTGDRVTFSMEGTFKIYDEHGGGAVKTASAEGVAVAAS